MTTPAMITELFKTVDEMDVKGFLSFLTDDATFTFANVPGVTGHDEIGAFVGGFFSSINGIHHALHDTWEHPDTIICRGEVTYTRLDDSTLTVPFINYMALDNDKIKLYQVYIDASALHPVQA